ncbi:hypothetical protein DXM26_16870 [Agrobacterium tumefaciens]|nr:hypothetical protein DXM26_16870 [Agrobacterium tumefaciens]
MQFFPLSIFTLLLCILLVGKLALRFSQFDKFDRVAHGKLLPATIGSFFEPNVSPSIQFYDLCGISYIDTLEIPVAPVPAYFTIRPNACRIVINPVGFSCEGVDTAIKIIKRPIHNSRFDFTRCLRIKRCQNLFDIDTGFCSRFQHRFRRYRYKFLILGRIIANTLTHSILWIG